MVTALSDLLSVEISEKSRNSMGDLEMLDSDETASMMTHDWVAWVLLSCKNRFPNAPVGASVTSRLWGVRSRLSAGASGGEVR